MIHIEEIKEFVLSIQKRFIGTEHEHKFDEALLFLKRDYADLEIEMLLKLMQINSESIALLACKKLGIQEKCDLKEDIKKLSEILSKFNNTS